MSKVSQLKKNNVVRLDGQLWKIRQIHSKTTSARGASTLITLVCEQIRTRQRLEKTFRSEDVVEEVVLERRSVQYLYQDGDRYVFMNAEDYSQFEMDADMLEGQAGWLSEGMEDLSVQVLDGRPIGLDLPAAVEATVTDTTPALKGATVTAQTKPALLDNGVTVQVPEYIETGDRIRVMTEGGRFVTRI